MKRHFLFIVGFLFSMQVIAQTGIGTATPDQSAKLHVASDRLGFLPPQVALTGTTDNTTIKNAAGTAITPAVGLLIFNTATAGASPNNVVPGYYYWNGSSWLRLIVPTDNLNNITGVVSIIKGGTGTTTATGSGSVVLSASPTLITPALGTPSSATLTNATGLPISSGVSGLGTNVASFLATPTSANLISAMSDETGTGLLVFGTSPTLTTPTLGVASATSLALTGTTSSTSTSTGALTIAGGVGVAGQIFAGGIQNTPIGNSTASSGSFTSIVASGNITATGSLTGGNSSTSNISGFAANVVSISANYDITSADNGKVIQSTSASAINIAIPTGLPTGFNCTIVQMGAGQITFTGTYLNRGTFTKSASQYSVVSILHLGSNNILVTGEMSN